MSESAAAKKLERRPGGAVIREVLRRCYRLRRLRCRVPRALILMYHRILPDPGEDSLGINVSLADFAAHLAILQSRFNVVPMAELERRLRGNALGPSAVAITIDDGYHDGYRHALPALRARDLSATFFVPTDLVGGSRPMADQRLGWMIENTAAAEISMQDGTVLPLVTRRDRHKAAHRILRDMSILAERQREELLRQMGGRLGVGEGEFRKLDLPVSWPELLDLRRQGMTIGCHSSSHRSLAGLPARQLERELDGSRALLERRLGAEVRFLSYPYGRPRNVSREVVNRAARAGFALACTASPGPVLPASDPLLLRRLEIQDWDRREFHYRIERAFAAASAIERFPS